MARRGGGIQWKGYTPRQAGERYVVLKQLLDSKVLTEDEEKMAGDLLGKLSRASRSNEEEVTIIVSEESDQFLDRLEEAMWEMKH